jgi:hypothetical protein
MKAFSLSCLAIVIAAIAFAFTNKKLADGVGCQEYLYWFKVVGNSTCGQISSQWQIEPIEDVDGDGCLTSIDFNACPAGSFPYGCSDMGVKACCLGYRQTIGADNQIEAFCENGLIKFRPKSFEIVNYRCCIKHLHQ